jgi:excisionase family DNA binding protein
MASGRYSRVGAVAEKIREIIRRPENRSELVLLASKLTFFHTAAVAALMRRTVRGEPPQALSMPAVAKLLDVPEYTVREMGRTGELPTIRLGRYVRVPIAALRRKLDELSQCPASDTALAATATDHGSMTTTIEGGAVSELSPRRRKPSRTKTDWRDLADKTSART